MTERPMDHRGAALAVFLCLIFGSNALAIKRSVMGLTPFACVMVRFAIASLIIYGYARLRRIPLALSVRDWGHAAAMGAIFGLQMAAFYLGISHTTVSHAGVLMNTQPFFVAIMAHFFLQDDRLTMRKIAGIALAFVGVAVLFSGGPSGGRAGMLGDLMITVASFLWAAQTIYIKRWTDHWDSIPLVLHPMVISMGIFVVCYLFLEVGSPQVFDGGVIASLIYQSVIAAGFGYIGWTELLLKYKASSLSVFVFIMPVATVGLGVLLMGDTFSAKIAASLVLVAVGILVVNIAPREAFVMPE